MKQKIINKKTTSGEGWGPGLDNVLVRDYTSVLYPSSVCNHGDGANWAILFLK